MQFRSAILTVKTVANKGHAFCGFLLGGVTDPFRINTNRNRRIKASTIGRLLVIKHARKKSCVKIVHENLSSTKFSAIWHVFFFFERCELLRRFRQGLSSDRFFFACSLLPAVHLYSVAQAVKLERLLEYYRSRGRST